MSAGGAFDHIGTVKALGAFVLTSGLHEKPYLGAEDTASPVASHFHDSLSAGLVWRDCSGLLYQEIRILVAYGASLLEWTRHGWSCFQLMLEILCLQRPLAQLLARAAQIDMIPTNLLTCREHG